jgi:hypothetical protein
MGVSYPAPAEADRDPGVRWLEERYAMRNLIATAVVCALLVAAAGCGDDAAEAPAALPRSGAAYGALGETERLSVAESCRDRAAAAASGVAAEQLREIDPRVVRARLDLALKFGKANGRRPVWDLCSEQLPFVTPGLAVTFSGATDSGDAFTYQTRSDKPLTIQGTVSPAGSGGYVTARSAFPSSPPLRGEIGADGRFVMPTVRLRKVADNSFVVTIHSPPNALRKVRFSAICVDCLAAGPPPAAD